MTSPGEVVPVSEALPVAREVQLREEIRWRWIRAKRLKSKHTAEAYDRDITTYFGWCDARKLDVLAMFPPDVEGYVEWLQTTDNYGRYRSKTKPRSKATIARMVTAVSSFYAYARKHTQGQIINPVDLIERPPPADAESQTRGLSAKEVARLRDVARKSAMEYALVQLLVGTGLRVSEVCGADVADLTTDSGHDVLIVTRKGGKRGPVPVPPGAAQAIERYVGKRVGPLFLLRNGRRMTRRMVDYHLTKLAKLAGIEGRRISPHSLRHTAATLALDAGASMRDVQIQLDHSRSDTTARYDRARRGLNNAAARALAALVAETDGDPP